MLAIAILALCAVLAARFDPSGPPVSGRARISDGDSFHLGADRVRLLGIDAPELDQSCKDAKGRDWPCGRAAKDHLVALVGARPLDCRADGHDRFGRILAHCSVGGRDLGVQMIEAGMAVSFGDYEREEAGARRARVGVWAGSFEMPRAWRDRQGRDAETEPGWDWLSVFKR